MVHLYGVIVKSDGVYFLGCVHVVAIKHLREDGAQRLAQRASEANYFIVRKAETHHGCRRFHVLQSFLRNAGYSRHGVFKTPADCTFKVLLNIVSHLLISYSYPGDNTF